MNLLVNFTLLDDGPLGIKLADIICDLIVKGAPLGELDEWVPDPSDPKAPPIKRQRMPREWLDRLDKAIETGAFETLPADRIVEIILQGQR
jgi:hypothetical protein